MTKKMSKPDKAMLTAVIVIAVLAVGTFIIKQGFKPLAIIPELDNRINYYDVTTDVTQLVEVPSFRGESIGIACDYEPSTGTHCYENDKFYAMIKGGVNRVSFVNNLISISAETINGHTSLFSKKDFAELKTYVRLNFLAGRSIIRLIDENGQEYIIAGGESITEPSNIEIIPDNLNDNIYNIFYNGEFYTRITTGRKIFFMVRVSDKDSYIGVDYIKFVPNDAYVIRNDEVWVKEVRGSSYSYKDLNWEMIGFNSEIRPATIRDLTAQTEKPAPQIYVNLINNLPVNVEPNNVHTFYYRTKWVQGLDSSCQGQLDKVEVKGSDGLWHCESYVRETPIIQQCQTINDCPILPDCEAQRNLVTCQQNKCNYDVFTPQCKNQLITYQEKVIEIENTKFVPIISGTNSFYCFFDETQSSCNAGEKTISMSQPSYVCAMPSDSSTIVSTSTSLDCWQSTLTFDGKNYIFKNNEIKSNIGFNIKAETSMSASLDSTRKLRKGWGIATKFTLPDSFLDLKVKNAGNRFVLQNSIEPITFTITNNLGFGIDGSYAIQTQNIALEGGVVLRHETKSLFLKSGDNDITYNFETKQLGSIADLIMAFGRITTDKEYIMKSSSSGMEKYLVITKEVKTEIPAEIEKVQPKIEIVERVVEKPVIKEVVVEKTKMPIWFWWAAVIIILFIIGFLAWTRYGD